MAAWEKRNGAAAAAARAQATAPTAWGNKGTGQVKAAAGESGEAEAEAAGEEEAADPKPEDVKCDATRFIEVGLRSETALRPLAVGSFVARY